MICFTNQFTDSHITQDPTGGEHISIKDGKDTEELPQTKAGQSARKYPPELKTAPRISQSAAS